MIHLLLRVRIEIEIKKEIIQCIVTSKLFQFAPILFGRAAQSFLAINKAGDPVHLQYFILFGGSHVFEILRRQYIAEEAALCSAG